MILRRIFWILMIIMVCCIAFYRCYFLRQPYRKIPNDENLFVSPANGEIIAIIENPTEETILYKNNRRVLNNFIEWIWSWAKMVSIMMTPLDVHYQRSPNNATLIEEVYVKWKRLNAMDTDPTMKSTLQNEYNAMLFETKKWVRYKIIQIAWTVARRIVSYVDVDDKVAQWDIIGLIRFGSQVTVIFDNNVDIVAKVWDKVVDWETVLAKMKKVEEQDEMETFEEEW